MKVEFEDKDLEELIRTGKNKKYKKVSKVKDLMDGLYNAYELLLNLPNASFLRQVSKFKYERLKYQYSGCSSIRIANGYVERLIFTEHDGGISVKLLKLDSTHYGNKK